MPRYLIFGPLFLALLLRLLYSAAQPSADPTFQHPALDGGYYLDWARQLASGSHHRPRFCLVNRQDSMRAAKPQRMPPPRRQERQARELSRLAQPPSGIQ